MQLFVFEILFWVKKYSIERNEIFCLYRKWKIWSQKYKRDGTLRHVYLFIIDSLLYILLCYVIWYTFPIKLNKIHENATYTFIIICYKTISNERYKLYEIQQKVLIQLMSVLCFLEFASMILVSMTTSSIFVSYTISKVPVGADGSRLWSITTVNWKIKRWNLKDWLFSLNNNKNVKSFYKNWYF